MTAEPDTYDPNAPTVVFSDSAAAKVADLIQEEGNPELKLRVFIAGGGLFWLSIWFYFRRCPARWGYRSSEPRRHIID